MREPFWNADLGPIAGPFVYALAFLIGVASIIFGVGLFCILHLLEIVAFPVIWSLFGPKAATESRGKLKDLFR
jgi:hypothetical protein